MEDYVKSRDIQTATIFLKKGKVKIFFILLFDVFYAILADGQCQVR
jgi:hypothetical protein